MRMCVAPCTIRAARNRCFNVPTEHWGAAHSSAQERTHGFTPPAKGAGPNSPQGISLMFLGNKEFRDSFLQHPASLVWAPSVYARIRDSSIPVHLPKKTSPELWGCNRTCWLTTIWASDVTSNVFKETVNTFKVNLITSCYPEKAKYRKNKDLTCTCIYYGQLMLTECFALILDLH